jgi:hypothetical protein
LTHPQKKKLSVNNILNEDLQSAAIGLGEMVILIVSISLGILFGTLVILPNKFVPIAALSDRHLD